MPIPASPTRTARRPSGPTEPYASRSDVELAVAADEQPRRAPARAPARERRRRARPRTSPRARRGRARSSRRAAARRARGRARGRSRGTARAPPRGRRPAAYDSDQPPVRGLVQRVEREPAPRRRDRPARGRRRAASASARRSSTPPSSRREQVARSAAASRRTRSSRAGRSRRGTARGRARPRRAAARGSARTSPPAGWPCVAHSATSRRSSATSSRMPVAAERDEVAVGLEPAAAERRAQRRERAPQRRARALRVVLGPEQRRDRVAAQRMALDREVGEQRRRLARVDLERAAVDLDDGRAEQGDRERRASGTRAIVTATVSASATRCFVTLPERSCARMRVRDARGGPARPTAFRNGPGTVARQTPTRVSAAAVRRTRDENRDARRRGAEQARRLGARRAHGRARPAAASRSAIVGVRPRLGRRRRLEVAAPPDRASAARRRCSSRPSAGSIARAEPRNAIGWIFLGAAALLASIVDRVRLRRPRLLGGERWPAAAQWAEWVGGVVLHPRRLRAAVLSSRSSSRTAGRCPAAGAGCSGSRSRSPIVVGARERARPEHDRLLLRRDNPLGVPGRLGGVTRTLGDASGAGARACRLRSPRWPRSSCASAARAGCERQQMKWLACRRRRAGRRVRAVVRLRARSSAAGCS